MDSCIWTLSCCWLGIWFPHCISCQAWSFPIVLITLLHLSPVSMYFQQRFPSFNFFSIFCLLISINPQLLRTFRGFFSELSNFSLFNSYFLTHTFNSQEITNSIRKNKTKILTGGGRQSPLLLTFSGTILRPLCVIPALCYELRLKVFKR